MAIPQNLSDFINPWENMHPVRKMCFHIVLQTVQTKNYWRGYAVASSGNPA